MQQEQKRMNILSYLKGYKKECFLSPLFKLLEACFDLTVPLVMAAIINKGIARHDSEYILRYGGVLILLALVGLTCSITAQYFAAKAAVGFAAKLRHGLFAKIESISFREMDEIGTSTMITRMTSDISGVQSVISNTLTSILSNIAVLATSVVAMYQKNWILATVGIIIVPLFVLPTKRVGKTRWSLALKSQEKNDEINQVLNETLSVSGQMLVKLFTNEKMEYEKYQKINGEMTRLNIRESMAGRWFRVAMNTFTSMGPMLIYLVGGLLIIRMGNTSLTVGDITVMVSLLSRMYQPVNSLLNIQVDVIRSMALFTRIFDYFDMPVEVENRPHAIITESVRGDLEFCHVGFFYDPEQPVLRDLNFCIEAGHSVAIVGPSGAGKSTMIHLIPRLYDVTEGSITLDGQDIRNINLETLRKNIGVVTQDTYLFNGTIRENLLYANAQASEEQLIEACRQANIHHFIAGLPQGYDTMVGNRGIKLSGGEKQRVSIARVILKNPRLLILDEATSALDSISESVIQDAIDPLLKGRTSLVIAHRLSTIMAADEILVVDQGQIVQRGTHQELVEENGVYRELYETQFRRALEDHKNRK